MIFTEAIFPLFLLVVLGVYWGLMRGAWRNHWLLVTSAVFYGWWDVRFLALIGAVIFVSWLAGILMKQRADAGRGQLTVLWSAIIFQLVMLGTFKYFGFFSESAAAALSACLLYTSPSPRDA